MKRADCLQKLQNAHLKYGIDVYSPTDLGILFSEHGQKLHQTVRSLTACGILAKTARGVYAYALCNLPSNEILALTARKLRPNNLTWESLESALSQWGVISQIPVDRITLMTTGREGEYRTPYGVIEFTHSKRKWSAVASNVVPRGPRLLPIASKTQAYRELKAVGRNLQLVDMEELEDGDDD